MEYGEVTCSVKAGYGETAILERLEDGAESECTTGFSLVNDNECYNFIVSNNRF